MLLSKQRTVLIIFLAVVVPLFVPAQSQPIEQSASTVKHHVTIRLKAGDAVSGTFLGADSDSVQVEVAGNQLRITLEDISSLVFEPDAEPAQSLGMKQGEPAREAVAALRRLSSATEGGLSYAEYERRYLEAKGTIDPIFIHVRGSAVRNEIVSALGDYQAALLFWRVLLPTKSTYIGSSLGRELRASYPKIRVQKSLYGPSKIFLSDALSVIWSSAREHLDAADNILQ
jgi:hypothetical protein